jgi:hypothetical protein
MRAERRLHPRQKNLIAIAQTGTDLTGRHVEVKERARAQSLVTALQDSQVIAKEQHAQLNLAGLLALVKSQQRIGDRKALIYFTQNQQMNAAQKELLKAIGSAAERAGVSIYAVDMNPVGNSSQYQEANALLNGQPPYNPARMSNGQIPLQQEYSEPIHGDPCPDGAGFCWGPKQDIQVMTDFMLIRAKNAVWVKNRYYHAIGERMWRFRHSGFLAIERCLVLL